MLVKIFLNLHSSILGCVFFLIRTKSGNTLALFNPSVMKNKKNEIGWDDQKYINRIKHKLKYTKLPLVNCLQPTHLGT